MPNISNPVVPYADVQGQAALRRGARENSPEALTAVAKQFEAMFIKMLLKGSRDSALAEDVLGGDKNDIYNDMHDQQMAQQLSQRGIGIADMLVRQLGAAQGSRADQQTAPSPSKLHKLNELGTAQPRTPKLDLHL